MAHFDSVTPFRASNVGKYLQMGLDDASKPRGACAGRLSSQTSTPGAAALTCGG